MRAKFLAGEVGRIEVDVIEVVGVNFKPRPDLFSEVWGNF